ncbi:MAG TPA: hypothetical protein VIU12_31950 [Chryseolinea sp.]
MRSQTISFNRTFLFFKKYAFENRKAYALLYLSIGAFLVLWLGVYLTFTNPFLFSEKNQIAYYFVTLFLAGCLSSGILFSELGVKPKAINYLLTPVSTGEKFLCNVFFGVLVFFAVYSTIFYAIDAAAVNIANWKYDTHWQVIDIFHLNDYENPFVDGPLSDLFYLYFPLQAGFILASIYFNKHGLFKALVSLGLLWVCLIMLYLLVHMLLPQGRFLEGIDSYEIVEPSGDNKVIVIPYLLVSVIIIFSKFLVTPALWLASYFRLKEKEL